MKRPAVPDMTTIDVRSATSALQALEYTGPESVLEARSLREQAAAMRDVAIRAQRAGHDVDPDIIAAAFRLAHESARAQGRMLVEGRQRGDIARPGVNQHTGEVVASLNDLGLGKNEAADLATIGALPDEVWGDILNNEGARYTGLGPLAKAARKWFQAEKDAADAVSRAEDAKERAEAELAKAAAALDDLVGNQYTARTVALTEQELSIDGAGIELRATVSQALPESEKPATRDKQWQEVSRKFTAFRAVLEQPLDIGDPVWAGVNVLAARDAAARIQDALNTWLRDKNKQWEDRIND